MRRFCLLAALSVASAAEAPGPSLLVFKGADGCELEGLFYAPPKRGAPALICLHGLGKDPSVWGDLPGRLQAEGYAVFSLRLRGHPEKARGKRNWLQMETDEFARMASDLEAARACLSRRREVDPARLALIGEEFGANLALAGGTNPAFRAAALLTPRLDARGLKGPDLLEAFGARPVLALASADDAQGAKALEALQAKAGGPFEAVLLPADPSEGDFGAAMLSDPGKAELAGKILEWLKGALPPS